MGDSCLIPGLRGSSGEENGNPLSILSWRIPWTEEPNGLQCMRLQRVENHWVTKQQSSLSMYLKINLVLYGYLWNFHFNCSVFLSSLWYPESPPSQRKERKLCEFQILDITDIVKASWYTEKLLILLFNCNRILKKL